MPIYSNNRTGSMALAQIAANESYKSEDFGRILYESLQNDMAFFEAILTCDFKEINGLREGTILESEVKALNEATKKSVIGKLIEGIKQFWAKLKGAFKDAINKIGVWLTKFGKPMTEKLKAYDYKNWKGSVADVTVYDAQDPVVTNTLKDHIYNEIENAVKTNDTIMSTIVSNYLGRKLGVSTVVTPKEYTKAMFERASKTETLTAANVIEFANDINNGKTYISLVKGYQNAAEKKIDECIKELKKTAEDAGTDVTKVNGIVRAYETVLATICKTNIALLRADMKSKASALTRAMGDMAKMKHEAAIFEASCVEDCFDQVMTCRLSSDSTALREAAELIASV